MSNLPSAKEIAEVKKWVKPVGKPYFIHLDNHGGDDWIITIFGTRPGPFGGRKGSIRVLIEALPFDDFDDAMKVAQHFKATLCCEVQLSGFELDVKARHYRKGD